MESSPKQSGTKRKSTSDPKPQTPPKIAKNVKTTAVDKGDADGHSLPTGDVDDPRGGSAAIKKSGKSATKPRSPKPGTSKADKKKIKSGNKMYTCTNVYH